MVLLICVMKFFNPLNAELNPICHLLALLGGATIVVVSRLKVKVGSDCRQLDSHVGCDIQSVTIF